ncbi:hypothetical protein C1Y08_20755 [Pseudomonas sp. FW306-02-F02-AA]|uniref:Uncharacterized protein n=1 Tax=Pseudomonas fluorescens TaxID=294 RepID=A0A0N9W045_PSEFL|nr:MULTISPECIES: hypothetical protein [Pseudomonas]ALI04416.1 hypothetical protein AO353_26385 [Pseudomonas fluorescens]PMZ03893.1 hypothetical protein C1Y07_11850 [Pseudomonas sp. FW306-02-F02-AB]PMZ08258.1 hypothetical protein C1Y06_20190 [Pseudomonas sp. FW306-02-H06C]PMZ13998.1 hypothetical protein C1Y08_20755 [Pseudomonas sp. FW306-02-F02-AA]PMZ21493.1 hypothetical protein C1Y09_13700 [Pseudomonas sp. FW306-02-F08-AA]
MFSLRNATLCLSLVSFGFASSTFANQAVDTHQVAVTLVAMGQICNKANPGLNGSIENAMVSDPKMDEATKAEVRKVSSDPAYKGEVGVMVQALNSSGMAAMGQDMCKSYAAK